MGKIEVIGGEVGQGSWSTSFLLGTAKMSRNFGTETVELKIKNAELQTEEKLKELAGSAGWGFAGALVGGVLTGGIGLLIGGLAGVLSGGNKSEVCFSCELQDGRKFLATTDKKTWQNILALTFSTPPASPIQATATPPANSPSQDDSSTTTVVDGQESTQAPKLGWMDLTQQQRDKRFMQGLLSVGFLLLLSFVGIVAGLFSSSPTDVTSPASTSPASTSSDITQPHTDADGTYTSERADELAQKAQVLCSNIGTYGPSQGAATTDFSGYTSNEKADVLGSSVALCPDAFAK